MMKKIFFALVLVGLLSVAMVAPAADANFRESVAGKLKSLSDFVKNNPDTSDDWKGTRAAVDPLLMKADSALAAGNDLYALQILFACQSIMGGFIYLSEVPAESRKEMSFLEAEWKKAGASLAPALSGKAPPSFEGVPSVARAFGQAAWNTVRVYYESSIEYGRNTVADAGLYYLGQSTGQLELSRFTAELRKAAPKPPAFPGLVKGMDDFEAEMLSRYKPPASIDSHPVFIRASAMLKEARELESAGMHEGALYMYLMSRLRLYRIAPGEPLSVAEATTKAAELAGKLHDAAVDQSIAMMFLQMATTEAADTSTPLGGQIARGVFEIAMPAYFAALDPAAKATPRPQPDVKITLVRWPYT